MWYWVYLFGAHFKLVTDNRVIQKVFSNAARRASNVLLCASVSSTTRLSTSQAREMKPTTFAPPGPVYRLVKSGRGKAQQAKRERHPQDHNIRDGVRDA